MDNAFRNVADEKGLAETIESPEELWGEFNYATHLFIFP